MLFTDLNYAEEVARISSESELHFILTAPQALDLTVNHGLLEVMASGGGAWKRRAASHTTKEIPDDDPMRGKTAPCNHRMTQSYNVRKLMNKTFETTHVHFAGAFLFQSHKDLTLQTDMSLLKQEIRKNHCPTLDHSSNSSLNSDGMDVEDDELYRWLNSANQEFSDKEMKRTKR
ncbi:hypothetical protein PsorP6_003591 [Peronosclerospora sorghi]|uniref:Uncharacterized protein n=1 Tax=Peronosclerospora sorghi TaxID=230839 RepID=A0ACC0VS30_9STRA|nr:hypothetical protein PsorP6_003591 [Peronosclerospora sorghi]